jgi:hypothetical protein
MSSRSATLILAASAGIWALLAGCASVKSTAVYYRSLQDFPAKPPNAQIPILTNRPKRPFKVIGRLAFKSDQGWNFLCKSMIYNAQIHGADAVWLKRSSRRRKVTFQHVPPRMDLYPVIRSEPPLRWVNDFYSIDARMIVFHR